MSTISKQSNVFDWKLFESYPLQPNIKIYIFHINVSIVCISYGNEKENLFGNHEHLKFLIISFNLMMYTFDSRMML